MLTFFLLPILALLPKRWRNSLVADSSVNWRVATMLSGFGESLAALIAMMYWYSYSVTHWAEDAVYAAIRAGARIDPNTIGFAGLALWAMHPLTWVIAFAGVEGMVRLLGTFTETYMGIFPLFVLEKIIRKVSGRSEPDASKAAGFSQGHFSSYVGAIKEKAMVSKLAQVADELCYTRSGTEELLEVRACRRKVDWTPPRTVRFKDTFYRLEGCSEGGAPRPFRYHLRRLTAGVMGRTVLVYSLEEPLVLEKE